MFSSIKTLHPLCKETSTESSLVLFLSRTMNLLVKYIIAVSSAALASGLTSYFYHQVVFPNVFFPPELSSMFVPLEKRNVWVFVASMLSFAWGMEWAMSLNPLKDIWAFLRTCTAIGAFQASFHSLTNILVIERYPSVFFYETIWGAIAGIFVAVIYYFLLPDFNPHEAEIEAMYLKKAAAQKKQ
mmetsp:Transcript_20200/g.28319  ORF Transcript_20200/g.28319 Transcript_20200/m.28319 type:complete len:185 (-) Transcript_20200:92-646(-)